MSYPVKWFHSDMVGAPQFQGSGQELLPGQITSLLDACLLNGFNTQSLDSLSYDSGTGEATGTVAAGHRFLKYQVILVEGANEPAFNGEQRVTFVDINTFKFIPATAPPATATGTITVKAAPLGQWEKTFSGTNKAAYRSVDPLATGFYLRVDDTVTDDEKPVIAYESMTSVDIGTNQFGLLGNQFSVMATPTNKWAIVGDARFFYLYAMDEVVKVGGMAAFGDINHFKPADSYHCVLLANDDGKASGGNPSDGSIISQLNSAQVQWRIARSYNTATLNPQVGLYGSKLLVLNPNPFDGNFYINDSPLLVVADNDLRGTLPGLSLAYNDLGLGFHIIDNANNSTDVFLVLKEVNGTSSYGQAAFNLTRAWR